MIGDIRIYCAGDCGEEVDDDNRVSYRQKEYCSRFCTISSEI